MNVEKIREDFPYLKQRINGKPIIYFDNTATSQKPKQVIDKMNEYYFNYCANIHRAVHRLSIKASEEYEKAHDKVAKFVNAKGREEVIFVRNATEALNLVYYAWGLHNLKKGDEVITTVMEHHSNLVPFMKLREWNGIKIKYVDVNSDSTLKMEQFEDLVTNKTKIIAVIHVSNALGTINPVKEIGKIAKDTGALFVLDAAQSLPHMPINFKDLNADFLAFSGHKILGPTGGGALVGKKDILEKMEPFLLGGEMIKTVHLDNWTANILPWKFEAGTAAIAEGIGLGAAIDYISKLGMKNVREHEKELTEYILERIKELNGIELYGPLDPEIRGGIISFNVKGMNCHDVGKMLDEMDNIACRTGMLCAQPIVERLNPKGIVRASFYIYNTKEEIDVFIKDLKQILKLR